MNIKIIFSLTIFPCLSFATIITATASAIIPHGSSEGLLGSPCTSNADCRVGRSECDVTTLTCMCSPGSAQSPWTNSYCVPKGGLLWPCRDNSDCTGAGQQCYDYGYPPKPACLCDPDHYQSGEHCLPQGWLGSPCNEALNLHCTGGGLSCAANGRCKCHENFIPAGNNKYCIPDQQRCGPSRIKLIGSADGKAFFAESGTTRTWFEAQEYCADHGMTLGEILTQSQYNLVNSISDPCIRTGSGFWTGARESRKYSEFMWQDTKASGSDSFMNWQDQDNSTDPLTCAYFSLPLVEAGNMQIAACESRTAGVICQT